jgi:hypothetical protein
MKIIPFLIILMTRFATTEANLPKQWIAQTANGHRVAQASEEKLGLSGEWFDKSGKKWLVTQQNDEVRFENPEAKLLFKGALKGRVIKYTSSITLQTSERKECQDYIGTKFEFETRLVVSEDANKMGEKAPDSVSKGDCKLSLKKKPVFTLSRPHIK